MSEPDFIYEEDPQIPVLRFNRAAVHNAVNEAVMDAWEQAMARIKQLPDVRAVILTANGEKSFCSGGDLRYFDTLKTRQDALGMVKRMKALLDQLYNSPTPVIAAINGDAYGGGCEVLTACHFRLAVSTARFAFRQAVNGVITGWGGGVRLMRQLPRSQAMQLLLTSQRIDAVEAVRIGFVDRLVPREQLMSEARALARTIADNSPLAVASFLELSRALERDGETAAQALESDLFCDTWMGDDFARTLARFRK